MKIGVLALQGSFAEHMFMLRALGVEAVEVRLPGQIDGLDGLIIPGGESTTMGKLAVQYGLIQPLRDFGARHALWGTCAGAIMLSKDARRDQLLLELMDMRVQRNAFGSQAASFEADLDCPPVCRAGGPFHAVFIRAPVIESIGPEVQALARLEDGRIVAAQQGRWLATSFHPELTGDGRFHQYFLGLV